MIATNLVVPQTEVSLPFQVATKTVMSIKEKLLFLLYDVDVAIFSFELVVTSLDLIFQEKDRNRKVLPNHLMCTKRETLFCGFLCTFLEPCR